MTRSTLSVQPALSLLAASWLCTAAAGAQTYDVTVGTKSSTSFQVGLGVDLPGHLIGDFDDKTNPGGTRTLPGLFGGSGNQPVDVDVELIADADVGGVPTGDFELTVDARSLTVAIEDLSLDILGGADGSAGLTLVLLFQNFRTFAPDSVFFGGIPLPIPLATADVRDVLLVQSGSGPLGTLTAKGTPGEYAFSIVVPVDASFQVEALGQVFDVGPLPIALPLVGTLTASAETVEVTFAVGLDDMQSIDDPFPGFSLEDLPFGLPTIFPPGNIANVLFTLGVSALTTDLSIGLDVSASGAGVCGFDTYCTANMNSSGNAASISASGSASVEDADLTLTVENVPLGECGYFVMSESRTFVPQFGGSQGNLCVGSPQVRLAMHILYPDTGGVVTFSPPFNDLPQDVTFEPGSTWNFQLWFRDQNPTTTSNTSDAVEVRFCL